jgi:D-glycero-alpha-D-manno-heptose-7-phosphate kinase
MIVVRSPLRLTFGGGGTDVVDYYSAHEGFSITAAINKYVYVAVSTSFTPGLYLKYVKLQEAHSVEEVENPHIRQALRITGASNVSLTTFADIPAGTGLGSSGAISCALLKALFLHTRCPISQHFLAHMACYLERGAGVAGGRQDQFASAYGGISALRFLRNSSVEVTLLNMPSGLWANLEARLLLFFTGYVRNSGPLHRQPLNIENLHEVKAAGIRAWELLRQGRLSDFGSCLNEQWILKEARSPSPPDIVKWRQAGLDGGAKAGKLIGAGQGGFLMFYTDEPERLRLTMSRLGLVETPFRFDLEGTKVMT